MHRRNCHSLRLYRDRDTTYVTVNALGPRNRVAVPPPAGPHIRRHTTAFLTGMPDEHRVPTMGLLVAEKHRVARH
jgi:hypothetical protein